MARATELMREAFANPNPLAIIATVGFVVLFAVVVIYVTTDRRRRLTEKMQNLPLEDDRHA